MQQLVLLSLLISSTAMSAGNIAFGNLKGIKVYDQTSNKVTKLYYTRNDIEECAGVATITHSLKSEESLGQMVSLALSAYMSGSKVRAYSSDDTCELDVLTIQESYF